MVVLTVGQYFRMIMLYQNISTCQTEKAGVKKMLKSFLINVLQIESESIFAMSIVSKKIVKLWNCFETKIFMQSNRQN
jgi:hypothetical protein